MSSLVAYTAELDFAKLPLAVQEEVDQWCTSVRRIIDGKPKGLVMAREAEYLGVSISTVRAKFAAFLKQGKSWRAFVDARKLPHLENTFPDEFLEWFLISLCGGNQRKSKPAHRKLIRMWQQGEEIPGYRGAAYREKGLPRPELERPKAYPGTDMPWGWSYPNLMKAIKKNPHCAFLLALCRQGPVAASALMPNACLSSRVGLRPGQFYMPDDRWIDCDVIVSGQTEPCRPIELGFGDVCSTKKVCWGIKPQIRKSKKSARERTRDVDMRLLLAQLLCLIGFHRDGCTFIIEHGTATMPQELINLLCALSGGEVVAGKIVREGSIRVEPSGMQGGIRMLGGYLGKRLGNFKAKASYESGHNLFHNESADLPAQKGKNPDFSPEDDGSVYRESTRLLTAMLALRPELREHVQFKHLHFKAFLQAYMQLKDRIEDRIVHRIQDWEECGFTQAEYRVTYDPKGWRPYSELGAMSPVQRQAIEALIKATPHLYRVRRLSPNEVWHRGQSELTVLPIHCMRLIMGEGLMETHRVQKNGEFVFRNTDISENPLRFIATATDDAGTETILIPGREYRTWINVFTPDMLFVEELGEARHGQYLGICRPIAKVQYGDKTGRFAATRAHEQRLEKAMAPYYKQGQKLLKEHNDRVEHNTKVFGGEPITETERRAQEIVDAEQVSDADREAFQNTEPVPSPTPNEDLSTKDFA